jgi:hypothetical protein
MADGAGGVAVTWRLRTGSATYSFQAAVRRAGGAFGAPQTLSGSGGYAHGGRLFKGADGSVIAAFLEAPTVSDPGQIRLAEMPSGGTGFAAAYTVSFGGITNINPWVAKGPRGDTVVIWSHYTSGTESVPQSRIRRPNGLFSGVQTHVVPAGRLTCSPGIGVDAAGNATAVWELSSDPDFCGVSSVVQVASAAASDETFGSASTLAGPVAADPRLVVDRAGAAVVAYRAGSGAALKLATRPAGGAFATPEDLGAVRGSLALSLGPQGRPLASWRRTDTDTVVRLYGSQRGPDGGAFSAPVTLGTARSNLQDEPSFTTDAAGNGAIGWLDGDDPSHPAVLVGGFDAAGPLIGTAVAPSGPTGIASPFSSTAADAFSAVAGLGWAFGDGGFAATAAGTHAYRRPGAYAAKVAASDSLGNSTTRAVTATAASPALRNVSLRPSRFKVSSGITPVTGIAAAAVRGATLRFRISLRGRVRMEVLWVGRGGKLVRKGTLRRVAAAGSRRVRFGGRLGRRALAPGRYRMRIRTVDAAGNLGKPVTLSFTIVR